MAKCAACGKFLSSSSSSTGVACCSTCPLKFHKLCVGMLEKSAISKDWCCPECSKNRPKGDNSCTPVKGIVGSPNDTPLSVTGSISPLVPPIIDTDVRDMRHELALYMTEVREFRKIFKSAMDSLTERMNVFERRLEALEQKSESASAPRVDEVTQLQETVVQLKMELNDREQDAILTDIEIGQLPEDRGENTLHVVTVLATKLGVALEERDVVFAERIGPLAPSGTVDAGAQNRARRVVVRFARRQVRDDMLRAARVRRSFTTGDIGLSGPQHRVYINERLTRTNRQLFHRVREECRKRQWRYSWTRRGRIYARQGEGMPAYPIRAESDFERVFGRATV